MIGIFLFVAGSALCLNCDAVESNLIAHHAAFLVGAWVSLGGACMFVVGRH